MPCTKCEMDTSPGSAVCYRCTREKKFGRVACTVGLFVPVSTSGIAYLLDASAGAIVGAIIGAILSGIIVSWINRQQLAPGQSDWEVTSSASRVRTMPEDLSIRLRKLTQLRNDGAIEDAQYQKELEIICNELSKLP